METINFTITKENNNMCRITTSDCRSIYKKMADGGCICSLDVMLADMEQITKKVESLGNKAAFHLYNPMESE